MQLRNILQGKTYLAVLLELFALTGLYLSIITAGYSLGGLFGCPTVGMLVGGFLDIVILIVIHDTVHDYRKDNSLGGLDFLTLLVLISFIGVKLFFSLQGMHNRSEEDANTHHAATEKTQEQVLQKTLAATTAGANTATAPPTKEERKKAEADAKNAQSNSKNLELANSLLAKTDSTNKVKAGAALANGNAQQNNFLLFECLMLVCQFCASLVWHKEGNHAAPPTTPHAEPTNEAQTQTQVPPPTTTQNPTTAPPAGRANTTGTPPTDPTHRKIYDSFIAARKEYEDGNPNALPRMEKYQSELLNLGYELPKKQIPKQKRKIGFGTP